jgi:hypothetical protein
VPYIVGVFAAQIGNGGKNLIWSNMLSWIAVETVSILFNIFAYVIECNCMPSLSSKGKSSTHVSVSEDQYTELMNEMTDDGLSAIWFMDRNEI